MPDRSDPIQTRDLSEDDWVRIFDALSHPIRIRIIGILATQRRYISEMARLLCISRPLLYMHLQKLEAAELIMGQLELSEDGKAMKYYTVADFHINLTPSLLRSIIDQPR